MKDNCTNILTLKANIERNQYSTTNYNDFSIRFNKKMTDDWDDNYNFNKEYTNEAGDVILSRKPFKVTIPMLDEVGKSGDYPYTIELRKDGSDKNKKYLWLRFDF